MPKAVMFRVVLKLCISSANHVGYTHSFVLSLNYLLRTTDSKLELSRVIFLFTSKKCTWCNMVKEMLEEELEEFLLPSDIYEVDIEKYQQIAQAYGILVVPTLVAGGQILSGLPTQSDLRSFLMQSVPSIAHSESEKSRRKVLSKMQKIMREQREQHGPSVISPLKN
jgi:thioredoxin-like negative regulator of GroEL